MTPDEPNADSQQFERPPESVRGSDGLYHDLDEFIGTWVEDPAFNEAMKYFDQIDDEMWTASPEGDLDADA